MERYVIEIYLLTTFFGSKKICSFQLITPTAPMLSLAVVNFFSLRTSISIIGSTVPPSGTFNYLACSIKTFRIIS
jgi:hypothetical protein